MPYRKVTYLEQILYLLLYGLKYGFGGEERDRKTAPRRNRKPGKKLGRPEGSGRRLRRQHPHRFRRTLATNLIGRGMPIQNVAVILGHDKLDTTMKYVYLDKADVRNSYKRYM